MGTVFYCNGKKGVCNKIDQCDTCKHFDGSGGREIKKNGIRGLWAGLKKLIRKGDDL